jgi:hypothetical protein
MSKIDHFYSLYEQKFAPYKERSIKLLEIGVQDGSSIAHWRREYPKWDVWGVDVDEHCRGNQIIIGDQADPDFVESLGGFDIVIDDGGHTMNQQQTSFNILFPKLSKGGLYVMEDLHTSYWPDFADAEQTTTDYLKNLTDSLHIIANEDRLKGGRIPRNTFEIASVHFYPSIAFIYKK